MGLRPFVEAPPRFSHYESHGITPYPPFIHATTTQNNNFFLSNNIMYKQQIIQLMLLDSHPTKEHTVSISNSYIIMASSHNPYRTTIRFRQVSHPTVNHSIKHPNLPAISLKLTSLAQARRTLSLRRNSSRLGKSAIRKIVSSMMSRLGEPYLA